MEFLYILESLRTPLGDAFFSAAVAALTRGLPLHEAVRQGTELASRTLKVRGSCA